MKKYFFPLLGLIIISVGLVAALSQTQVRQEVRKLAVSPGGAGKITLSPQTVTKYAGEQFAVNINVQTGTTAISGIALRLTYPYTGTIPEFDAVDQAGNPSNQIYPNPALPGGSDWSFPVKTVTRSNGTVTIEFAAINQSFNGFTSSTSIPLATIYFKANRATSGTVALSFDTSVSKMKTKTEPAIDILDTPVNGSITVQTDNVGPNKISNLTVSNRTQNSVSLAWTAPADIPSGNASTYEVRYSTNPITDAAWTSAQLATSPVPKAAGQGESLTVSGLNADTPYYFAVKSKDNLNNVSLLSNVVSATTLASSLSFGSFGFRLQSFNKSTTKTVALTLKNSTITKTYTLNVTSDPSGFFKPVSSIDLTGLSIPAAGGTFDAFLKEPTHLQKKLGSLTLNQGSNTIPAWAGPVLRAGDFDNNNELNIDDITDILVQYVALSIPINSTNAVFDVDGSNTLDIDDITDVLVNYTALVVSGDK